MCIKIGQDSPQPSILRGHIMETMPGRRIDSIIETLYASICGASGQERNWDRLRELFLPGARIYRADVSKGGCSQAGAGTIEEIIETISGLSEDNCFAAREIARHTEASGNFAKVLSTYEVRYRPEDEKPFRRGRNRIQLYHDGRRWRIMNMLLCDYRCDKHSSGEQPAEVQEPDSSWIPSRRNFQFQSASNDRWTPTPSLEIA